MEGGSTAAPGADDSRVRPEEKIWRLIPPDWYPADPASGQRSVIEAAFSYNRDVSALRAALVNEADVKSRYPGHGIAELAANDIRNAGCTFQIMDVDEWPPGSHVLIRNQNGKRLKPRHWKALTNLANKNLRVAPNVP